MTEELTWSRVKAVFDQLVSLNKSERDKKLQALCDGNQQLEHEVSSLLNALDNNASFLETPLLNISSSDVSTQVEPGDQIGPYRLLDQIGEGGMGTVYEAIRNDGSYSKQVALKLIRSGQQNHQLNERFIQERQILASLEHPGISRLIDGGTTEKGDAYLVMELIDGVSISKYCDQNQLTTQQIVSLFIQVCDAVHYAHQNLIIHRDITPENIFVNAEGKVKLLDFGIAKLVEVPSGGTKTQTGMNPLTPDYASPEQILGRSLTTASDIYSLGVVLYLLLTGEKPRKISGLSLEKMLNIAQQDVELLSEDQEASTGKMSTDLRSIVLFCLRADPGRRYESARQLSKDLEHFLKGDAVLAHPDTWAYRSTKFIQKHWFGVSATVVTMLVLVVFSLYTLQQANDLREQKKLADMQRDRAELEAEKARTVAAFLTKMINSAKPENSAGGQLTVKQMVDKASENLNSESKQLGAKAEMNIRDTLAQTYLSLGQLEKGLPHALKAVEMASQQLGEENPLTLSFKHNLATFYLKKSEFKEAARILEETLVLKKKVLGVNNVETAKTIRNLATAYALMGNMDGALKYDLQQYEVMRSLLGEDDAETMNSLLNIATDYHSLGQWEKSADIFRKVVKAQKKNLGPKHPNTLKAMNNLAVLLRLTKHEEEAEKIQLETLAIRREVFGDNHPETFNSLNNLAELYIATDRYEQALPLVTESYQGRLAMYGPDHQDTLMSQMSLAQIQMALKNYTKAEKMIRSALVSVKEHIGEDSLLYHQGMGVLIEILKFNNKQQAMRLIDQEIKHRLKTLGAEHPYTKDLQKLKKELQAANNENSDG